MFLLSLVLFPVVSYFMYNKFKDDVIELNWVAKLIWLIGVFVITFVLEYKIFDNNESYFILVSFWYVLVFAYFYISIALLQYKNIEKSGFKNTSIWEKMIKILFMIGLFIFCVSIFDNYKVYIIQEYFIFKYIMVVIMTWIFYEIIEVVKKSIIMHLGTDDDYRRKLKDELKEEILKELNLNK